MSFFEEYLKRDLNLAEEICNIDVLLKHEVYGQTIYGVVKNNFLLWPQRRTCVKLSVFKEQSEMDEIIEKARDGSATLTNYLKIVEIVISWMMFIKPFMNSDELIIHLWENILYTLSKLNYKIEYFILEGKKVPKCIEKDFKVFEAAEIVDDVNLSEKIFLYHHMDLKGNLYEKAIILSRLYMYFEGVRKILEGNNYSSLCKLIGDLSDKLKVRHKPSNKESLIIDGISNDELEDLYDKLFSAYLTAIVTSRFLIEDKDCLQKAKDKFDGKNV